MGLSAKKPRAWFLGVILGIIGVKGQGKFKIKHGISQGRSRYEITMNIWGFGYCEQRVCYPVLISYSSQLRKRTDYGASNLERSYNCSIIPRSLLRINN